MIRSAFPSLALLLLSITWAAQPRIGTDDYLLIRISTDGKAYQYGVDLSRVEVKLLVRCEDSGDCPIYAGADKDPDVLARNEDEKLVQAELSLPGFSKVSLDRNRAYALVAQRDPHQDTHQFEIFSVQNGILDTSGTITRRIVDVEWVGANGCFVLLTAAYRLRFLPYDWSKIVTSLPPGYNTYYLELHARDGSLVAETLVHKEVMYGWPDQAKSIRGTSKRRYVGSAVLEKCASQPCDGKNGRE